MASEQSEKKEGKKERKKKERKKQLNTDWKINEWINR